jgi:F-box domain
MDAINTNQRKDVLSDLNKDVLRELCKYLDVHEFHRFALTSKRVFKIIHKHPYKRLRSEKACLFRKKGFKRNGGIIYCCKCWHKINDNKYRLWPLLYGNAIETHIIICDNTKRYKHPMKSRNFECMCGGCCEMKMYTQYNNARMKKKQTIKLLKS